MMLGLLCMVNSQIKINLNILIEGEELSDVYRYEGRVWKEPINDLEAHRASMSEDEQDQEDRYSQIDEGDNKSLMGTVYHQNCYSGLLIIIFINSTQRIEA